MRHFYTRLTLGIVFLIVCLVFSIITLNIPFATAVRFSQRCHAAFSTFSLEKRQRRSGQRRSEQRRSEQGQEQSGEEYSGERQPEVIYDGWQLSSFSEKSECLV